MRILVYLRDGRTCYVLRGRAELGRLLRSKPDHEDEPVVCVKGTWNPTTGTYNWVPGTRLRHIGQVSHVEEGHPNEAEAPAA